MDDKTNNRLLKRWPLRLFLKKASWLIIAITGIPLIVLVGFSIYGNNVGDLVVSVDANTVRSLSLSETGEFGTMDSTSLLSAEGIKNIRDSTYAYVPNNITEGNGLKSDRNENFYFAYSFYLKNVSNVSVGYSATLKLDEQSKGIDKAIRIMVIVDDNEPLIFARPNANGEAEVLVSDGNISKKAYTTIPFTGNSVEALSQPVIEVNAVQKYTIVMWLEGWDEDCNDSIVGGKLAVSMTFKILESDD